MYILYYIGSCKKSNSIETLLILFTEFPIWKTMVFKRHLLFLSLPSLALALGLVWFRRKRSIDCDTGGHSKTTSSCNNSTEVDTTKAANNQKQNKSSNQNIALPIGSNNAGNKTESSPETKLGKSAPIDIIPNSRSPPFNKSQEQRIDPELLTSKIIDSEYKTLKSIEEQEFESLSPIDLPDSIERRRFSFTPKIIRTDLEQPVIVKASMAAKISPKNSFPESKYTEECPDEERDSANHSPIQEIQKDNDKSTATNTKHNSSNNNEIQHRNPPVSSPALSECSLHSNDSGKGSSPPHSISGGVPLSTKNMTTYEFTISQMLVGQIIGRKGIYINQIKSKTGASVVVKKHPETNKVKVCSINGTEKEVDAAVQMIRSKFPENKYPNLTMKRIYLSTHAVIPLPALDTTCLRVS